MNDKEYIHEINNYINVIYGVVQLDIDNIDEYKEYFQLIKDKLVLIKQLSDNYRKYNGDFAIKHELVDVKKMLNEISKDDRILLGLNNLKVISDGPLLNQVFINIISNALKFCKKNVIITCINGVVAISDDGSGLSKEEIVLLGNKHFRSAKHKEIEGSGLGWCIVKKILNKLNLKYSITSGDGKFSGLTVKIYF